MEKADPPEHVRVAGDQRRARVDPQVHAFDPSHRLEERASHPEVFLRLLPGIATTAQHHLTALEVGRVEVAQKGLGCIGADPDLRLERAPVHRLLEIHPSGAVRAGELAAVIGVHHPVPDAVRLRLPEQRADPDADVLTVRPSPANRWITSPWDVVGAALEPEPLMGASVALCVT